MRYLTILFSVIVLSACSGPQVEDGPPPPPTQEFAADKNYEIGVGDDISIKVWRNEELSVRVPVRPDGKVSSPLVGDIVAAGLTTEELAAKLTEKLSEYVRNPEVTVIINNPASANYLRRVRITGAVQRSLSIPHHQGMTVLDLVLEAGGLTEYAAANDALLYRKVEGGATKAYPIYLRDILENGKMETNYTLYPTDVVSVPGRNF